MTTLRCIQAVFIAALALLSACTGGPRLSATPSSPVDLSGHWVLDPSASDDAAALIRAALPRMKEQRRARYDMWGNEVREGADPSSMPPGSERGSGRRASSGDARDRRQEDDGAYFARQAPPVWGRIAPFEYVAYFAIPSERIEVRQSPGSVTIGIGGRLRAFSPSDEDPINLTDRFGSRSVRGGWAANDFVIASYDGRNVRIDDSMKRLGNNQLSRTIVARIAGVKTITVHALYRRANDWEITSSAEDGPPAPVR